MKEQERCDECHRRIHVDSSRWVPEGTTYRRLCFECLDAARMAPAQMRTLGAIVASILPVRNDHVAEPIRSIVNAISPKVRK